jgi:membrane-bound lytic murein transglycosylase B
MKKFLSLIIFSFILINIAPMQALAQTRSVSQFVEQLKQKARSEGISESLLNQVFTNFKVSQQAIAADKKQPEDKLRFTRYKNNILSAERIRLGRALYRKHYALLNEIAGKYGVPAQYIVALWGTETSFGSFTGGFNVPHALASLAYEGRREELFTKEFIASLKIIEAGHISYPQMKGSWAGAMGQCQFMPSSFFNFAVDYDGDGHKNIWTSTPDVFASIANYLSKSGWNEQEKWGRQVKLPAGFDITQENINGFFPLAHWKNQGVTFADGTSLPNLPIQAAFMLPSDDRTNANEGAYLVYHNFHVLLKWNFSRFFGTAVGLLADEIAKG